ncbi:MAG: TauD/TfdA family dioxygenase [Pseudomonadota bacterium]|nr:TauD/TfdA family dioxygenase [Pseudomonadota bacterium]
MKVERISDALGARVTGVEIGSLIEDAEYKKIQQALLDYQVLVFPDQELNEVGQLKFTRWFGEPGGRLRKTAAPESDRVRHPGTMLVSNIREDGKPIGSLPDGELMFHSDGAFAKKPFRYTLLYALEVPKVGGNTMFSNMYKAFEMLPNSLKKKLKGCHAEHLYYANNGAHLPNRSLSGVREHPIFIAHEETERTALYVSRLMTNKIVEFSDKESKEILAELLDFSESPELIYEHCWTPGDFVIWDNRCLNHARTDFCAEERRLLRRTTVVGVDPLPADITV